MKKSFGCFSASSRNAPTRCSYGIAKSRNGGTASSRRSVSELGSHRTDISCALSGSVRSRIRKHRMWDGMSAGSNIPPAAQHRRRPFWAIVVVVKALVKSRPEPGLWLDEIVPPKIGINDVLIQVLRTGICGTDLHIYKWDEWAQGAIKVPMAIG